MRQNLMFKIAKFTFMKALIGTGPGDLESAACAVTSDNEAKVNDLVNYSEIAYYSHIKALTFGMYRIDVTRSSY